MKKSNEGLIPDSFETEFRWKRAFEITGDGIWEWNCVDGKLFFSNESKKLLGYSDSGYEPDVTSWFAQFHPEDLIRVEHALARHFRGETDIYTCEYRIKCKDSNFKWVLARGKVTDWVAPGKPRTMLGTLRDTHASRISEIELKRLSELQSGIITHSIPSVFTTDTQGLLTSFNPAAERILGYKAGEVVGKESLLLWHDPESIQKQATALADEFGIELEAGLSALTYKADRNLPNERVVTCKRKNGSQVSLLLSLTAIREKDAKISGYLGIAIDQTERNEAEKESAKNAYIISKAMGDLQNQKFALDQHAIVATTDIKGRITYVNDKFCLVSKYSREDLLGQNHRLLNSGTHSQEFFKELYQVIHSGKVWHGEIRNRAKDGTFYWVDTTIVPMKDDQGKIQEFVAIRTEITDRKRNEEVLKERQVILEATNESYPGILIACVDLNYNYLNFNSLTKKTVETLFGTKLVRGYNMLESITVEKIRREVKLDLDRAFSGESHTHIIETGVNSWLTRFSPMYNEQGVVFGASYFTEDISKHKALELEQSKSAYRLSLACDGGGIGIWEYDIINDVLIWDRQMFVLYGVSSTNFISTYASWQRALHPEDREKAEHELNLTIHEKVDFNTEFRVVWPDGTSHHIRALAKCLRDSSGQALSLIGTNWDITERKNSELQIKSAMQEAEAASRSKSEFLANMSHELRTPLNSVIGFSNILLKNKPGNLKEQDLTYLSRIADNGKHLLRLINSVLDLSKIEAGQMEIEMSNFDLVQLSKDVLVQFESQTREANLLSILEAPKHVLPLRCDDMKFKQVLINLIGNALKFTEAGSITIRIRTDADGNPIVLDVVDTGIGIPKNHMSTIFGAFHQADNSIARRFGGTGLGLTISRSLLMLMGFSLDVTSTEGKGSTFSILFKPQGN